MTFSGKAAMVTGAAKGIGKSTSLELAKQGARVGLLDINADGAEQTASEIRAEGGEALAIATDVADSAQVDAAVEQIVAEFGHLDLLVNNAYISGGYAPVGETTDEVWSRVVGVNLTGFLQLCPSRLAGDDGTRRRGHRQHVLPELGFAVVFRPGCSTPPRKPG